MCCREALRRKQCASAWGQARALLYRRCISTVVGEEAAISMACTQNSSCVRLSDRRYLHARDVVCIFLFAVSFLFSFWAVTVGWNNTIFDAHPFRQAQTAFTTYYLRAGGSFLKYETPVLGPPWSIPFEVPVYQAIVAVISRVFHAPLDQCGRLVSIAFFYATCLPLFVLVRELGVSPSAALATLTLFAISPHYIFWSHTFMIESTALFLAVAYLTCVVIATRRSAATQRLDWLFISLSAVTGMLAGLTKVTTYAAFFLAGGLWIVWEAWKMRASSSSRARAVVAVLFVIIVPLAAILWWTSYSDSVKEANAMGHFLTSHSLREWNFGTWQQRIDPGSYTHFAGMGIGSVVDNLIGSRYVLLPAFYTAVAAGGRCLFTFFACCGLYLTTAFGAFLDASDWRNWLATLFLMLAIGLCVHRYFVEYYSLQHTNAPGQPAAAAILDRDKKSNDVIVVYGLDWSSQLPYQARRRALMAWKPVGEQVMDKSIQRLGADHVSALLICGSERQTSAAVREKWEGLGFRSSRSFTADDCEIYEP